MADAEKLLALAERVERAVQPDREIDCLIRCALSGRPNWRALNMGDGFGWGIFYETTAGHARFFSDVPMYTESVDAAMTLLPEGAKVVEFHQDSTHDSYWWCGISGADSEGSALSKSAPRAFTAACLRARARGEE